MCRLSRRSVIPFLALLGLVASASPAPAAPPAITEATRAEARERFSRALRLFNENDNAAALAEYLRVYELVPTPVVLYNIGLVYATMGRPVEAVDALDKVLRDPGPLTPEQIARATETRAAQTERVGLLSVRSNVEGATVEVDNLDVAHTPLSAPIKVSSGFHVVAAVHPGYVPVRKAITVAGRAEEEVALDLQPMQGRLAHLVVRSDLPSADVLVDGEVVGQTPLASSLSLVPGRHKVALRRTGYMVAGDDVTLGDGAEGEITLNPGEDPALSYLDGVLSLDMRETATVITIDGRLRGAYTAPLHLPVGPHHVRVERSGFFASERDVLVPANGEARVTVALEPTPDTLARYTNDIRLRHRWGWISVIGGAAFAAGGSAILFYDAGQRSSDKSQYTLLTSQLASHTGSCDFSTGSSAQQCYTPINSAAQGYNDSLARDAAGWTLLGVGVVGLATGTVLLITGDDPHRYDRKPATETLAEVSFRPIATGGPGGGWLGVQGTF
jgi:PEGA domain